MKYDYANKNLYQITNGGNKIFLPSSDDNFFNRVIAYQNIRLCEKLHGCLYKLQVEIKTINNR